MNNKKKGREEKHYMKEPTCPFLSHKLPPDVNEVAYVIAKVHKYGNIDDYAEKLIREDIEKRRKSNDTEDSFKEYLERMLLPSSADYYHLDNKDDTELIPITLRLKKTFVYVLRLLAKHYDEGDIDKFISEEVSKIIYALAEGSSTILGLSISDELEQHIQSLLKEEQKKKKT
jgi:hypothetical protein